MVEPDFASINKLRQNISITQVCSKCCHFYGEESPVLSKFNIIKILTLSGLLLSSPAIAAKDISDFQTWGTATATGSLKSFNPELKKFKYWAEFQARFGVDSSRFSQAIVRPGIGYEINKNSSAWLGYGWIPTDEPFTKTPFNERRLWQQFLWKDNNSFGAISSRTRLEQRWAPRVGDDTAFRLRQMLKISSPMKNSPAYSLVASDEYFLNLNDTDWSPKSGFDQNRLFLGIGYNFDKETKTEIGYMNQYINRSNTSVNLNDHILSINFIFDY